MLNAECDYFKTFFPQKMEPCADELVIVYAPDAV